MNQQIQKAIDSEFASLQTQIEIVYERIDGWKRHEALYVKLLPVFTDGNAALNWDCTQLQFTRFVKDKEAAAAFIEKVAKALGQQPDIEVRSASNIQCKWDNLQLDIYLETMCKTIEVTKTLTTIQPHPECLAALKQLEDLDLNFTPMEGESPNVLPGASAPVSPAASAGLGSGELPDDLQRNGNGTLRKHFTDASDLPF